VVFTPQYRERLRATLLAQAREDDRITGAAVTGSHAGGTEDRWSDVDLAFGVRQDVPVAEVIESWTRLMYGDHDAVANFDVPAGPWIYRVFLLANTLQVDLAFVPAPQFAATAPTFRLVFGEAADQPPPVRPTAHNLLGLGWVFALHVRSCLERGKPWQAEWMISEVRDQVLSLACHRLGLPVSEGRGFDRLPEDIRTKMAAALVRELTPAELRRAFGVAVEGLLEEAAQLDGALAERLRPVLEQVLRPAAAQA
jgi:hypothetical protein